MSSKVSIPGSIGYGNLKFFGVLRIIYLKWVQAHRERATGDWVRGPTRRNEKEEEWRNFFVISASIK